MRVVEALVGQSGQAVRLALRRGDPLCPVQVPETAIHVLRLVLSGALDRHPEPKLIIGHMGRDLPSMFARCDQVFADEIRERLTRAVSRTITDQVWVTTSGFFALAPLLPLLMTFGAGRVMFRVDHPFSPGHRGREFLDALPVCQPAGSRSRMPTRTGC